MAKLFPLILFIIISCNETSITPVPDKKTDALPKSQSVADSLASPLKKNQLGKKFHHTDPFEIVSFNKGVTLEYTGPDDTSECKNWKIKKENLPVIFKNSKPIDGTIWDLAFAFTTCVINGQLRQNGQYFEFSVNAGSWFSVTCQDTTLLFGDYNKRDRKFFLETVMPE